MSTNTKFLLFLSLAIAITFVQAQSEDWANIERYSASDAELSKLPAGTNQVVFMGDSITDIWNLTGNFSGKSYVNRGISGQITLQMLVRLRYDVIDLQPEVMVLLGGTNDLTTGYETAEMIEGGLASMIELVRAHNITPILATVLPVCGNFVTPRPPAEILEINAWIKNYCETTGTIYLDYFSSMVGPDGLLRQELTYDCLHPNQAGFAVMQPLAEAAIEKALQLRSTMISI